MVRKTLTPCVFGCLATVLSAEEFREAAWAGEDEASAANWSVFMGEHGGQFTFEDRKRQKGCRGLFLRSSLTNSQPKTIVLSGYLEPYCGEGLSAKLEQNGSRSRLVISTPEKTWSYSGKRIFPIDVAKDITIPDGADVLGITLGMGKDDVRAALATRLNFENVVADDPSIFQSLDITSRFDHHFGSGQVANFTPSRLLSDQEPGGAIYEAQKDYNRFDAETYLLDPNDPLKDRVTIIYADGAVADVRRTLRVNKDSLEATHTAMNEKYGSFPLERYLLPQHYFGFTTSWLSYDDPRVSDFYYGAGWGAASYTVTGEKLSPESVDTIRNTRSTSKKCIATMEYGPISVRYPSGDVRQIPNSCSTTTYYAINAKGLAEIGISHPFRFISPLWEVSLGVLSDQVTNAVKKLKLEEGAGEASVPEL